MEQTLHPLAGDFVIAQVMALVVELEFESVLVFASDIVLVAEQ